MEIVSPDRGLLGFLRRIRLHHGGRCGVLAKDNSELSVLSSGVEPARTASRDEVAMHTLARQRMPTGVVFRALKRNRRARAASRAEENKTRAQVAPTAA